MLGHILYFIQIGGTALMLASYVGCIEAVQLLLNMGAHVNSRKYVSLKYIGAHFTVQYTLSLSLGMHTQ